MLLCLVGKMSLWFLKYESASDTQSNIKSCWTLVWSQTSDISLPSKTLSNHTNWSKGASSKHSNKDIIYFRKNHRFIYFTETDFCSGKARFHLILKGFGSLFFLVSTQQACFGSNDLLQEATSTPENQPGWFQTKHPAVGWRLQRQT